LDDAAVHFAPVRHHSPACARAVRALIAEVQPAAVLIEGSSEFDALLPILLSPETQPPVAVLSLHRQGSGPGLRGKNGQPGETVSTIYPLADFSPEWVALRAADSAGASIAFIDQPHGSRVAPQDDATRGLMGERYYAESRTLAALARDQHCRDHDELWEHLFELRRLHGPRTRVGARHQPVFPCDWQRFFDEVFHWAALARLDYEPEVLEAEGSTAREAVMAAHVAAWRARVDGPLVVVTGAFHTLALVETLAESLAGTPERTAPATAAGVPAAPAESAGHWLIRYDLTRLDAHSGYGAGIRSPGYYQRQWDATGDEDFARACLIDIARHANAAQTADRISLAEVKEACLQAERLAELRGHPWPGRTDLLDACTSCFASGESLPPAVRDGIGQVFGGSKLGMVPKDAPAPPIVAEAREQAAKLRFNLTDSARHHTVLDIRRSANARRRARFLALMSYLRTGFGTSATGPDYVFGRNLGRLREEWDYAWTPMVEAALIALAPDGATLAEAARTRLRRTEAELADSPARRSSREVAKLVAQAALVGLPDEVARLIRRVDRMAEHDPDLGSVVASAHYLTGLWRSRDMLDLESPATLVRAAAQTLPQVAYLADQTASVKSEDEPEAINQLLAAWELADRLAEDGEVDPSAVRDAFARLRTRPDTAPGVSGCVLALGVQMGDAAESALAARLVAAFSPGADPDHAVRFLNGLMRTAPDLFLHIPELFEAVDAAIGRLSDNDFLIFLPDLRRSFGWLKPFETARLAERVAARTGLSAPSLAAAQASVTADDLLEGAELERALRASLARDGLLGWADGRAAL
jgi:hypothetical protein